MNTLTAGTAIRYYGTGKLAKRTSKATVVAVEGRNVTVRTEAGNVFTIDITRVKAA